MEAEEVEDDLESKGDEGDAEGDDDGEDSDSGPVYVNTIGVDAEGKPTAYTKLKQRLPTINTIEGMLILSRRVMQAVKNLVQGHGLPKRWTKDEISTSLTTLHSWLCNNYEEHLKCSLNNGRRARVSLASIINLAQMSLLYIKMYNDTDTWASSEWTTWPMENLEKDIRAMLNSFFDWCNEPPADRTVQHWKADLTKLEQYTSRWIVEIMLAKSFSLSTLQIQILPEAVTDLFELITQYQYWIHTQLIARTRATVLRAPIHRDVIRDVGRFVKETVMEFKLDPGVFAMTRDFLYEHWMPCGMKEQYLRLNPTESEDVTPLVVYETMIPDAKQEKSRDTVQTMSMDVRTAYFDTTHPVHDLVVFFVFVDWIRNSTRLDFLKEYYISQYQFASRRGLLTVHRRFDQARRPIIVRLLGCWTVCVGTDTVYECNSAIAAIQMWIQALRDTHECRTEKGVSWQKLIKEILPSWKKPKKKRRRKRKRPKYTESRGFHDPDKELSSLSSGSSSSSDHGTSSASEESDPEQAEEEKEPKGVETAADL